MTMRNIQVTTLTDRLLYGPDKPNYRAPSPKSAEPDSPTDTTATSPTLAVSSPTESNLKGKLSAAQSTATSPVEPPQSAPASPTEDHGQFDQSVTSSPTVASSSPIDPQAKQQYYTQEAEIISPTSTNTAPPPESEAVGEPFAGQTHTNGLSASQATEQRPSNPLRKAWKSILARPTDAWHPTALQIRPLVGISGIIVVVVCIFASLTVLMVSDGQATADWYVAPAVLLAIITALANSAIALAYMEAVPVSFWYSMTRGRTIQSLERQWQVSRSMLYAVAKIRHMSVLNIACIAAAIVVIDGPLLQRASTVQLATQATNVTLSLRMLPEIPANFTGDTQYQTLSSDSSVLKLFPRYTTREPMRLDGHGCNGKCLATIEAPGVSKTGCSHRVWPITPEIVDSVNASWGEWRSQEVSFGTPSVRLPTFQVSVTPVYTLDSSAALMKVGILRWDFAVPGRGAYTMTACYLVPAICQYDVVIEDGAISIPKTPGQGRVLRLANNTHAVDQSPEAIARLQPSGMDAISVDIGLVTNINMSVIRANSLAGKPGGMFGVDYLTMNQFAAQHYSVPDLDGPGVVWQDPTEDIVFVANELMFRAGHTATGWPTSWWETHVDPGVEANQTVQAKQEITQNVYRSDLRWYIGAAVVQIATALIILPMFLGWWRLGCNLTLSPFSIALAFDSPLLRDVNSAMGPKGVIDRLGGMKLKYGAVGTFEEKSKDGRFDGRLGVANSDAVFRPHEGMVFER